MKQVAVIGAGGMGTFHAETLAALDGVQLSAVCDPLTEAAERAAHTFDLPVATDPEAVAAHGYDGVVIASPDATHAELTLIALRAGSRVLCEKPLAHDVVSAEAVVAEEVGIGSRRVQVGLMRQYDTDHVAFARRLADEGPAHYLRCTHRNDNDFLRSPEVVIVQSLIHDIHTLHWLGGEILEADARLVERPGGVAHVVVFVRMTSGISASIEFSDRGPGYSVDVEATTAGGLFNVTDAAPSPDWFGWFAEAYRIQDRAWVESLDEPESVGPSAWDGLAAQRVAAAALESLEQGRPVAVEPSSRPEMYGGEQ